MGQHQAVHWLLAFCRLYDTYAARALYNTACMNKAIMVASGIIMRVCQRVVCMLCTKAGACGVGASVLKYT